MELPSRNLQNVGDTWDLAPLYDSVEAWQSDVNRLRSNVVELGAFSGKLGQSAQTLNQALRLYLALAREIERIYTFAHLRSDEDTANSENVGLLDVARGLYTQVSATASFIAPELLSVPENTLTSYLNDPLLADLSRFVNDIVRYRPHTLGQNEELLLAMGSEVFGNCSTIFSQLHNADFKFEPVEVEGKTYTLSHGSYVVLLRNPDRSIRNKAFHQYYAEFDRHKYSLAAALSGSIKTDVYLARAKHYGSSREKALFPDNIPLSVYDNLVETVSRNLDPLHKYYDLRKQLLSLPEQRIFDTYTPLVTGVQTACGYITAAETILKALAPLGEDYVSTLGRGLLEDRWVDRYENKGKRSGAYSSGCYDSPPYILLNYKEEQLDSMFTLAHEAGHSMHSFLSRNNQPYQDHDYTIFVAEVASTFNEELLLDHLRETHKNDPQMLAYLLNHEIDDIKATLFRQTMFAEFELIVHQRAENNQPLTLDVFRSVYRQLLHKYFGDAVTIDELDELECLRIGHFYSAFYVYKYATGIAAAISLAKDIQNGDNAKRDKYLEFLKSGCSKYPLELLKDAGVDLTTPVPIEAALSRFSSLVDKLEQLMMGESK